MRYLKCLLLVLMICSSYNADAIKEHTVVGKIFGGTAKVGIVALELVPNILNHGWKKGWDMSGDRFQEGLDDFGGGIDDGVCGFISNFAENAKCNTNQSTHINSDGRVSLGNQENGYHFYYKQYIGNTPVPSGFEQRFQEYYIEHQKTVKDIYRLKNMDNQNPGIDEEEFEKFKEQLDFYEAKKLQLAELIFNNIKHSLDDEDNESAEGSLENFELLRDIDLDNIDDEGVSETLSSIEADEVEKWNNRQPSSKKVFHDGSDETLINEHKQGMNGGAGARTGGSKNSSKRGTKSSAVNSDRKNVSNSSTNKTITKLHEGKQGKHVPGHNNFRDGKSEFTHKDPQGLLNKFSGKGKRYGNKEVVDFGENIGNHVSLNGVKTPTTKGTIHYDSFGNAHIVPARPRN